MRKFLMISVLLVCAAFVPHAHAAVVNTCATATAGTDYGPCNPNSTTNAWGDRIDASTVTASTMVMGCAGSTLVSGASVVATAGGNDYGLPQCQANNGRAQWQPASFWATQGLVWDTVHDTFVTLASAGYAVQAAAAPLVVPDCYWLTGKNFKLSVSVSIGNASVANPAFLLTWFCQGGGQNGWNGNGFDGYLLELPADWSDRMLALQGADKATLDALWKAQFAAPNDPELLPALNAQLAATWPPAAVTTVLKTTGTNVFYIVPQAGKYLTVAVGTAPIGTVCNQAQSVNGMYVVPLTAVTLFGNVKPTVVVAPCG